MISITQWLESLRLGQYAQAFEENDIDSALLSDLTDDHLETIGITSVGHRMRILKAIKTLDGDTDAAMVEAHETAAPLPSVTATSEAERRQLTVMFCDLVGSVELGERMDVEDYRDLLGRFRKVVVTAVEGHGGFVARHQGDGLLVYFGYPQAYETDAERAVAAGLGVVQAVLGLEHPYDVEPAVRVGIATGPAVVGDVLATGSSRESEFAALGPTPNLAARVQGQAAENTVLVSETTQRLCAGLFEFEKLSPRKVKGISDEITPYRAQRGVRGASRFMARAGAELSPFVGREEEVELLARRWFQANDGHGQVVLLLGEAGIGKSRLTERLRDQISTEPHHELLFQCSPDATSSALHPVIAALEKTLETAGAGDDQDDLERLRLHLGQIGESSDESLDLLAALISLPTKQRFPNLEVLDAAQIRERTLRTLVQYIHKLADRDALLCAFEDVHWADPSTRELIGQLVETIENERVLILMTSRPGFEAPWMDFAHTSITTLTQLPREQGQRLAQAMAAEMSPLSPDIVETIVSRASGNPLFIEELTRTVVQLGASATEHRQSIPATLHDSLMARLDDGK
ncbi:MAG: AAA family ATPase, partial [Gammaproteobacteria bacterium]|nr:AAA family ATPase [Gammaproteobacteria bacterium]